MRISEQSEKKVRGPDGKLYGISRASGGATLEVSQDNSIQNWSEGKTIAHVRAAENQIDDHASARLTIVPDNIAAPRISLDINDHASSNLTVTP